MGRVRASPWSPSWRIGLGVTELLATGEVLLPEERDLVHGAGPVRLAEFATGRACARVALARMGYGSVRTPVLRDARGAPRWPPGVVGSIAHCTGWTGAVAARGGRWFGLRGIGLDAEPREPLPSGVLEVVASGREHEVLGRLAAEVPGIPWDTVLFCAKEATYKAWYPLTGTVLGHDGVVVSLSASRAFTAVARGGPPSGTRVVHRVRGRWTVGPRVVVTMAVLP